MKRIISLEKFVADELSYRSFFEADDEQKGRDTLIKRLRDVIANELTDNQRQLIEMYYFGQKNIPQIAGELKINRSTVSRGLKRARVRIGRCMGYDLKTYR